jgi:transposase
MDKKGWAKREAELLGIIESQNKIIEAQKATIETQKAIIESLTVKVADLTVKVTEITVKIVELEAQLAQNSQNSSKPPSSDGPRNLRLVHCVKKQDGNRAVKRVMKNMA